MVGGTKNRLIATTCIVAVAAILPVTAQEIGTGQADDAPRQGSFATLSYASGAEFDDNLGLSVNSPGVSSTFSNDVELTFGKTTARDRLVFGLSGDFRYEIRPDEDNEFLVLSPRASLNYNRFGVNSNFRIGGNISRRDLSRIEEFEQDIDGDGVTDVFDLLFGSGLLLTTNVNTQFVYGLNAPIKLTFSAGLLDQTYDVDNDELFDDSRSVDLSVAGEFRFSPVTTGLASVSTERFDAEDIFNTSRDTNRFSVGLRHDYTDIWQLEANVGYAEITTVDEDTFGEVVEDGTDFDVRATRQLSYGSAFGEVVQLIRSNGARTTFRFGGAYDLPDGGLTGSIGVTSLEDGDNNVLFEVGYLKELRDGQMTANVARSVQTSSDVDQADQLVTELSLEYLKQVTESQSLSLEFDRNEVEPEVGDSLVESAFAATYSYGLTREWDVNLGYQHRRTNVSAGRTASSNSVSLTLSRDIDLF